MKNIVLFIAILYVSVINAQNIFISPAGDDFVNSGEESQPFKSLERASDEIIIQKKLHPNEDITIHLSGGVYNLKETLIIDSSRGGYGDQNICFKGVEGEIAIVKCTQELEGWSVVDPSDLPQEALHLANKIWVLENENISDGTWSFNMMYQDEVPLTRARKAMSYATPFGSNNAKFRNITQADIDEGNIFSDPDEIAELGIKGKNRFSKNELCAYLFYQGSNLKRWENLQDVELFMRTRAEWMYEVRGIKEVDEEGKRAFFDIPTTFSSEFSVWRHMDKNASIEDLPDFYAENALEFMVEDGDWCVNTSTGRVYLVSETKPQNIEIPISTEIIRVEGKVEGVKSRNDKVKKDQPVYNVHFKNICFEKSNRYRWQNDDYAIHVSYDLYDVPAAMLRFRGAEKCSVTECEFRNGGGSAIRFDLYAQQNVLANNVIHDMGRSGISLVGYPLGTKDVNHNNEVYNNYIYNIGQIEYNGMGIAIVQSGSNKVHNNLVKDVPFMGIATLGHWPWNLYGKERDGGFTIPEWGMLLGSNTLEKRAARKESAQGGDFNDYAHSRENEIMYNEVESSCLMLGDCNGIYINTSGDNNKLEYNFIHDIYNKHANSGIRTDDAMKNTVMSHNIIYNCNGGVSCKHIGNVYENNYCIFDSLSHPASFNGGIMILTTWTTAESVFEKTIRKNIIYTNLDTPTLGAYKTYFPLLWLRNSKPWDEDWKQAVELQDDSKINNNVGYNEKNKDFAFPPFMGSQSEINNPEFANSRAFDFTVTNTALLKAHGIEQLDVEDMGVLNSFPDRYRTPGMRVIQQKK